jgi:hypothetical protein
MDAVTLLRDQLKEAHGLLEATVGDSTPDQVHYVPEGHALPVGAAYAHVIVSEDILVNVMLKGQQLIGSTPGVETGLSEPMPRFDPEAWAGYKDWTRRVRVDVPSLRRYAEKVYAASDAYLASLSNADLDGPADLSRFGWGTPQLASFLSRTVIAHVDNLTGEISAVKGVQGLKGYPF